MTAASKQQLASTSSRTLISVASGGVSENFGLGQMYQTSSMKACLGQPRCITCKSIWQDSANLACDPAKGPHCVATNAMGRL